MSGFPGNLEHETIGEAKRGPLPELLKRRCHNVGILKGQVLMIEQRVERGSDLLSSAAIDRIEYPRSFRQRQMRSPGTARSETLCGANLLGIVTYHKSHQDVRINGAHGACEYRL